MYTEGLTYSAHVKCQMAKCTTKCTTKCMAESMVRRHPLHHVRPPLPRPCVGPLQSRWSNRLTGRWQGRFPNAYAAICLRHLFKSCPSTPLAHMAGAHAEDANIGRCWDNTYEWSVAAAFPILAQYQKWCEKHTSCDNLDITFIMSSIYMYYHNTWFALCTRCFLRCIMYFTACTRRFSGSLPFLNTRH